MDMQTYLTYISHSKRQVPKVEQYGWIDKFNLCVEYEQIGTLTESTMYNGIRLGSWLCWQKKNYKKGRLTDDQITKLRTLKGFRIFKDLWIKRFQLCLEYERSGKTITPFSIYNNFSIGCWLRRQKTRYRNGKLTNSQIAKLQELEGFNVVIKTTEQETVDQKIELQKKNANLCWDFSVNDSTNDNNMELFNLDS